MRITRFYIYALVDPVSSETRYIGKSAIGLSRLTNTLNKYSLKLKSPKNEWILLLLSKNTLPLFKVIEVCDFKDLDEKEKLWIKKYGLENLLNVAHGGDGGNTGKTKNIRKKVISKNLETGEITHYKYVWETEKDGFSPTKVSAVCLGKRKTHKGHIFSHKIDNLNKKIDIPKPIFNTKKPVLAVNKKTGIKSRFDSIKKAAEYTELCVTTVSNCLRNKTKCKTYDFKYIKEKQ